ncbi:hypothetical protein V1477_017799 [Vespula maculifrons]|uniref:Uncharacterized protein n=1 Tax=Vespula maculifrons TaxID=7453 RepID=A0ABD2B0I0_VESMC
MGVPRRSLANDPSPVFLDAILSEKKIVKEKFFIPLFLIHRYNSAPIGQILIKKYGRVGREEPLALTPVRLLARRALSSDPGPAFVGAIVSEKKIVKEKFFYPLFSLNRYNSAPVGQILIKQYDPDKRIWACRPRRSLANDPSPVFLDAILSEKKIVKEKFFIPLFLIHRYNSAPIGQILIKKYGRVGREEPLALTPVRLLARRALSSDPGPAFVGAIVSEKKIVKEKFFYPLFSLNRYNSAPVGQILIKQYGSVVREDPFPKTPVKFS